MEFSIVKFPEEDDVLAVVPNVWINVDKDSCFWPPRFTDAAKAARNNYTPDPSTWQQCKVTVMHSFGKDLKIAKPSNYQIYANKCMKFYSSNV